MDRHELAWQGISARELAQTTRKPLATLRVTTELGSSGCAFGPKFPARDSSRSFFARSRHVVPGARAISTSCPALAQSCSSRNDRLLPSGNLGGVVGVSEPWSILRALRAAPPGRAATDEARSVVFAAALEQAERFLTAAATVGYATKPVQLFYALSQAGRAIAAVRADEPWEIRGRGATVRTSECIASSTIEPDAKPRGAPGLVARARVRTAHAALDWNDARHGH